MTSQIICADSLPWMKAHPEYGHIITSLPDANELGIKADKEYAEWYFEACYLCFGSTAAGCVTVFMQTDRLANSRWLSKVGIILTTSLTTDSYLLWHKIELRRAPGKTDLYRPAYRNILAFGTKPAKPGGRTPDVIGPGQPIYPNGVSTEAAQAAINLALYNDRTKPILDPFCGRGTIPYVAKTQGAESLGIDIDEEQCGHAEKLIGNTPLGW